MKLTPKEFLEDWKAENAISFCHEMTCSKIVEFAEAYAEHCDQAAWVTDGSLPPVDPDVPETSMWVNILDTDGRVLSDYYSFENNEWHFGATVIKWRPLPTPPKQ